MTAALAGDRTAIVTGGASACAFLVRDDASSITGQVIGVNGGRTTT